MRRNSGPIMERRCLQCLANLGTLHLDQKNLSEARFIYERVLKCQEKIHGREHQRTLTTAGNLVLAIYLQGDRKRGTALVSRCYEGFTASLGAHDRNSIMYAQILSNMQS